MLGDIFSDAINQLVKTGTDIAKQKIASLTSAENLKKMVSNYMTQRQQAGTPVTQSQAISDVAAMTTTQVQDIAKEQGIPTWLIIALAGVGVVVIGGVVYMVTRRRRM